MNVVIQLTQFVGRDVINKNTTDLAVRCSTGSVELSCVAINTPLVITAHVQVVSAVSSTNRFNASTTHWNYVLVMCRIHVESTD